MNLNPAKTEFDEAEHVEIRRQVRAAMAAEGLNQADVMRQAEMKESTLSAYLNDKYTGNLNPPAAQLHKWLEARARTAAHRRRQPIVPNFQPLHTSRIILALLDQARDDGEMISIVSPPGLGKTVACLQYCESTPRSWYVAIDEATHGVQPMLLEILAAMGLSDVKGGSPSMLSKAVVAKALEAPGLIVLDEVNILSDKALNQVRSFNDATLRKGAPIGIAMVGNETINGKIAPTGTKMEFSQLSSRVATRRVFVSADPRDVVLLVNAWCAANDEHLTSADMDWCQKIAARPGAFRNIEKTFKKALKVSMANDEPLTGEHLRGAFYQLSGLNLAA